MRITGAQGSHEWEERLQQFIAQDFHGTMGWMEETFARRVDPQVLWPDAKTAIVAAMTYGPNGYDPLDALNRT
ncbi:MAG: epoxyqueuosine reductase, partial [Pseudomonadota bacterium]